MAAEKSGGCERLWIKNKAIGSIAISLHAFDRFCERYCLVVGNPGLIYKPVEYFVERLRRSFERAEIVFFDRARTVLRIINNGFKKARYLEDSGLGLRFVVAANRPILITVERVEY